MCVLHLLKEARDMSVGGLYLLYSVEETASNYVSGDSAPFRPFSSALARQNLQEKIVQFITETTSKS